jgi:FkbM family methyltransferase
MSVKRAVKKIISGALTPFGVELVRARSRGSMTGALTQAKSAGLFPKTVIDVGAAFGGFTLECSTVFPAAKHLLIEPLEEYKPALLSVIDKVAGSEYIPAAASRKDGEIVINVHADLVGSSTYHEREKSSVNGAPRTVPAVTVDTLVKNSGVAPPFLLKIDVQGAELDVLAGAAKVLQETEYLVLEVSFFEFFEGGRQFHEVIAFLEGLGFVAYDILGLQYRPLDNALSQADIVFVKTNGKFRRDHFYATPEQRDAQDKLLRAAAERLKFNQKAGVAGHEK